MSDILRVRSRPAPSEISEAFTFGLNSKLIPTAIAQAEEAENLGLNLRELAIGGRRVTAHRVLFTIVDNSPIVQRVRQAAQDRLTEDELRDLRRTQVKLGDEDRPPSRGCSGPSTPSGRRCEVIHYPKVTLGFHTGTEA